MTTGLNNTPLTDDGRLDHRADRLASLPHACSWFITQATELIAAEQYSRATITKLDEFLHHTRDQGNPVITADLFRAAVLARLEFYGETPELMQEIEILIEEMLEHARVHNLVPHQANAHAIRGRKWILAGDLDAALTEVARALAILDATPRSTSHSWTRAHAWALVDCWFALNQMGAFEAAEEIIQRIYPTIHETSSSHESAFILVNHVRALLSWGLRLERVAQLESASERFHQAALLIEKASNKPKVALETNVQSGVLLAAAALCIPSKANINILKNLILHTKSTTTAMVGDQILLGIATSRALRAQERYDEANDLLIDIQKGLPRKGYLSSIRLNLLREITQGSKPTVLQKEPSQPPPANPLSDYAIALEEELWSLRTIRITALTTRREHEKLVAQQGAIAQLALQDPLTELPNRRALEGHLHELVASPDAQPMAIAVIDLDGFKEVNDRHSHKEGDRVLKAVAQTLRNSLRDNDIVARYGGDEFIVLLPNTSRATARKTVDRALTAVAALPVTHTYGVTLSLGLVSLLPQETLPEALSRADKAMYEAKRKGGNQIAEADVVSEKSNALTRYVSSSDEPLWPREGFLETPRQGNCAHHQENQDGIPLWPEEEPAWPEMDSE